MQEINNKENVETPLKVQKLMIKTKLREMYFLPISACYVVKLCYVNVVLIKSKKKSTCVQTNSLAHCFQSDVRRFLDKDVINCEIKCISTTIFIFKPKS